MKRKRIRSLDTLYNRVGKANFRTIAIRYAPTLEGYCSVDYMAKEYLSQTYVDYEMTKTVATKILEDFNKGLLDKFILDSESKDSESVVDDFLTEIF